jgi:hypothetical protein
MSAYLLTWNPKKFPWHDLKSKVRRFDLRLIPVASLAVSSRGIFNQGELADEEAIYRRGDHRAPA